MKFTISLASEQDRPNRNGHIFTRPVLDQIVEHLNKAAVPVTMTQPDSSSIPLKGMVGETVAGSAKLENGRVMLDVDVFKLPENFRPMLGFGAFEASLDPGHTVLDIERVHNIALKDA